jgi:hypothetical protein
MAHKFFEPVDSFGGFTGWVIQTGGNPSLQDGRASELGSDGDEIAHEGFDAKTSVTCVYGPTVYTGNLTIPVVGQIKNDFHVDSVAVAYNQQGFPTMTVTGHKHEDGDPDADCRTYTPTVVLPARKVGIPSAFVDTTPVTPADVFKLAVAAVVGMKGFTYTLSCTHVDEPDGDGGHLAGDNHDGVEKIDVELSGEAAAEEYTIGAAFFAETNAVGNQGNTSKTTRSISMVKHIAHDVV